MPYAFLMMHPQDYEKAVAAYFQKLGYTTKRTPYSNDFGVDVFATKGPEKIAIQVKMYGGVRPVNRDMVFLLHGAKDYFECTKAIIVTDGRFKSDAQEVASKLQIQLFPLSQSQLSPFVAETPVDPTLRQETSSLHFDDLWQSFIMPLAGKSLSGARGKSNQILRVDWSGVERLTSNNKPNRLPIEIFRKSSTVRSYLE